MIDQSLNCRREKLLTIAVVALLAVLAMEVRLLTLPLGTDVDTGCFMVMMRSMAEGQHLYCDILCNLMPFPFLFGKTIYESAPGSFVPLSRIIMILLSASCVIPIFLIGRSLFGRWAGAAAAFFYALDIPSVFYARQIHVSVLEGVVSVWTVWAMLAALRATRRRKLWAAMAGAMAGVAFLTKQSSLFLCALYPALALFFSEELRLNISWRRMLRDMAPFILGGAAVGGAMLAILMSQHAVSDFWDGVVGYNFELRRAAYYHATAGMFGKLYRAFQEVFAKSGRWLWLALLGAAALSNRQVRERMLIPLLWLAAPVAFLILFYYETGDHYYLPWTAPVCLLAGAGVVMAAELWRKSIEQTRMRAHSIILSVIGIIILAGLGLALAHTGRMRYAWGLWALGAALAARLAVHLRLGIKNKMAGERGAATVVGLAAVLCAAGPYWETPLIHPEPYILVQDEKYVADMVKERLQPGDDVAVIASDALTIYGGWEELPMLRKGKAAIAPMLIEGALRSWSPAPGLINETTALWEGEYNVQFVIIYDEYWAQAQAENGKALREYISSKFDLWLTMDFHSGDYYGKFRIYQRRQATNTAPDPILDTAR